MRQKAFEQAIPILENSGIGNSVRRNLAICYSETGAMDDALKTWNEVMVNDPDDRLASAMVNALTLSEIPGAPPNGSADDHLKYLLIRYRSNDYELDTLKELALRIENEYLRPMGFLLIYMEALTRNHDEAEAYYELLQKHNPVSGFVNMNHLEVHLNRMEEKGKWNEIEELLSTIDNNDPRLKWVISYYRGKLGIMQGDPEKAEAAFRLLARNPFFEPGLIEAVRYYDLNKGNTERAYEIILDALQANEHSVPFMKYYSLIATKIGLDNYVDEVLLELNEKIPPEEFSLFENEILELRQKQEDIDAI
jgi:tetratricopeptide (TPR) repeat protein